MSPEHGRMKNGVARALSFVVLFALAIPWYWRYFGSLASWKWLGMPVWFIVACLASLAVSCNAAWQISAFWANDEERVDVREQRP